MNTKRIQLYKIVLCLLCLLCPFIASGQKLSLNDDGSVSAYGGTVKLSYQKTQPVLLPSLNMEGIFGKGKDLSGEGKIVAKDIDLETRLTSNGLLSDPIASGSPNSIEGVSVQVYLYDGSKTDGKGDMIYGAFYSSDVRGTTAWSTCRPDLKKKKNIGCSLMETTNIRTLAKAAGIEKNKTENFNGWKEYLSNFGTINFKVEPVRVSEVKVIIEVYIRNATFVSVDIPYVKTLTAQDFINQTPHLLITVSHRTDPQNVSTETQQSYIFSTTGGNGSGTYGSADKVSAVMGDKVDFEFYDPTLGDNSTPVPVITGLPKIWFTSAMWQRVFMCTPDYGPDQVEPWDPYIADTHYRMINSYPPESRRATYYPHFSQYSSSLKYINSNTSGFTWLAQHRVDPDKTVYKQETYYPKTKKFNETTSKPFEQRDGQSMGWDKEVLTKWTNYTKSDGSTYPGNDGTKYTGKAKYLSALDSDEYLYVGTTNNDEFDEGWTGQGITSIVKDISGNNRKDNWQHMWDYETKDGGATYPITWDTRGYPSFGMLLNDKITAYQKFQKPAKYGGDYYYNGYEIEDLGTFYKADGNNTQIYRSADDTMPVAITQNQKEYNNEMVWYDANKSTGPNEHPGIVTVTFNGGSVISFRLEVTSPLEVDSEIGDRGFYGSLTGTNYPLGQSHVTSYSLQGVTSGTEENYTLKMFEGRDSVGTPELARQYMINAVSDELNDVASYNPANKTLSAKFKISSGSTFLVAYYNGGYGEVPIAGRTPMVMDPMSVLTVPDLNEPYPFAKDFAQLATGSAAWTNEIEDNLAAQIDEADDIHGGLLTEAEGDRPLETQNELRKDTDPARDYTRKYGYGYIKPYNKTYVVQKGQKVIFSSIEGGRKTETYWKIGVNPYPSWRDLVRSMPIDSAAERLTYRLNKVQQGGEILVHDVVGRHYVNTFNDVGEFVLTVNYTGFFEDSDDEATADMPGKVRIIVTDGYSGNAADVSTLENSINDISRGEIKFRELDAEERAFLEQYNTDELSLDDYVVAEVGKILSQYTFTTGPRATSYGHRFGDYCDFNDQFIWSSSGARAAYTYPENVMPAEYEGTEANVPILDNPSFVNTLLFGSGDLQAFSPATRWPSEWSDSWLRHTSSNYPPKDELSLVGVVTDNESAEFTELLDYVFNNTLLQTDRPKGSISTASDVGFLRWHVWVAKTPTNGDKYNRWIKTTMNLNDFFNGSGGQGGVSGGGAFSGAAYMAQTNITNSADYLAGYCAQPDKTEMEHHLTDENKNKIEMYNDLKYGRMFIVKRDLYPSLSVFNVNPGLTLKNSKDVMLSNGDKDTRKPKYIYIATGTPPAQISMDPLAHKTGIPVLTFDAAEYGLTDLGSEYEISNDYSEDVSFVTEVTHSGYDRQLKITANNRGSTNGYMYLNIAFSRVMTTSPSFNGTVSPIPSELASKFKSISVTVNRTSSVASTNSVFGGIEILNGGNYDYTSVTHTRSGSRHTFTPVNLDMAQLSGFQLKLMIKPGESVTYTVDDVYIDDGATEPWSLSSYPDPAKATDNTAISAATDNKLFLKWLQESAVRFFDWNYQDFYSIDGKQMAVVTESNKDVDKVALSGMGFAIAVTIIAAENNMLGIDKTVAKDRVLKMTRWLANLNPQNGVDGWYGVPWHFIKKKYINGFSAYNVKDDDNDGKTKGEVSTIDWAMCTAAMRVARQYFSTDTDSDSREIVSNISMMLENTKWGKFKYGHVTDEHWRESTYDANDKIGMDCDATTGKLKSGQAWGKAFSEETEMVYAEALAMMNEFEEKHKNDDDYTATDYIHESDVAYIERYKKDGFYPSWLGAGFTYNWYQLFTGFYKLQTSTSSVTGYQITTTEAAYSKNSTVAYEKDKDVFSSGSAFGVDPYYNNLMGLTAVRCVNRIYGDGWIKHGEYISNQGSFYHGSSNESDVIQVAPGAYGAALALPFKTSDAIAALRAHVNLGFYNEYLGLPDNVQLTRLQGLNPVPSWQQLDLNVAPIAMAIDQLSWSPYSGKSTLSKYFLNDKNAAYAYYVMEGSFTTQTITDAGQNTVETPVKGYRISNPDSSPTTESELTGLSIYPNPLRNGDQLTIEIGSDKDQVVDIQLADIVGRTILKIDRQVLVTGVNTITIPTDNLFKGTYLISIAVNGKQILRRVVVL